MSLFTLDKNTKIILAWERRMMDKLGVCGVALCECLAWRSREEGEEAPSDSAVELALEWEKDPREFYMAIRESNKWCLSPTLGCIRHCDIWKDFPPSITS